MKKRLLSLLAFFTLFLINGCSPNAVDEMYIYKMKGLDEEVVDGSRVVITDQSIIQIIQKSAEDSNKNPGFANRTAPQFKIVLSPETYYLWIEDEAGTLANVNHSETTYSISNDLSEMLNQSIISSYKLKDDESHD